MKDQIELSVTVRATAAEIWRALTDETEDWWSEDVVLEPKKGGIFKEPWEDDAGRKMLASGKVLDVQPNKMIKFTWKEKDWPANAQTECTFEISEEAGKRVIKVVHTGWDSLPEAKRQSTIKDFHVGWNYHLKELKSYLDD
ncbi:SRPBCC domain-containing protein [Bdellovibrio sp. NC01]|uniref:SRPBCC family protein n=1 Tax=Bdellovibrio sp. NC01 TaxID=2220073 RepID=UPI0011577B75|nr:SRPBCC domain-containing protein [Bdellovibrio sp. NC01]QDK37246.1 hypothetical protein DOE51_06405 [Bdellovibrio sp. NC01]